MTKQDVEWIANPTDCSVYLKFGSPKVWNLFCESFGEFLSEECIDEFGGMENE